MRWVTCLGILFSQMACSGEKLVNSSLCSDPRPYYPVQAANLSGYWQVALSDSSTGRQDTLYAVITSRAAKPTCSIALQLSFVGSDSSDLFNVGDIHDYFLGLNDSEKAVLYRGSGHFVNVSTFHMEIDREKDSFLWSYSGRLEIVEDGTWQGPYHFRWRDYENDREGESNGSWQITKVTLS